MAKMVFHNVVDHRLLNNGNVCEDVTKIGIPAIERSSSSIENVSGMVMDVEMPNPAHMKAMEMSIAHNNGVGCRYLCEPGKHNIEVRVVRQRYNVSAGENEYESVKFRFVALHKGTEKGDIEKNNPYGNTEKFSILRYEEEINGEVVTLIDAMAGVIKINGVDCRSPIESLLN